MECSGCGKRSGQSLPAFIELRKGERIPNWNVWEMLSVEELFELDL